MKKKVKTSKNEIRELLEEQQLEEQRKIAESKESAELNNESLLTDEFETQLSSNEPIRELFTAKNIKYKTELTDEQRSAVAILYDTYKTLLSYGINVLSLKYVLDEYIDFGVSVGRKGRSEYVEAHKSAMQQQNQQNAIPNQMSNMKM